jgi:ABC-type oligopeptide transport system substrate-binding subunit
MLQDAEAILNTEAPILPLYYYVNVGIVRDGVDGCRPNSRNLTVFKGITVTKPAG